MQSQSTEKPDLPTVPSPPPPSHSHPTTSSHLSPSKKGSRSTPTRDGIVMTPSRAAVVVLYAITIALWALSITHLSPTPLPAPPHPWQYHAFLNFRGQDLRNTFSDHLYSALRRSGVRAFRDDKDLPRGENITEALLAAIEASMVSVVLLSGNYASSPWCLDELVTILQCRHKMAHRPLPVFYQVSPDDVQDQSGPFKAHFDNHKDIYTYNRVDGWIKSMQAVADLAGWHLGPHSSEAEAVEKIVNQIEEVVHSSTKNHQLQKKPSAAKNQVPAPAASRPADGKVDVAGALRSVLTTEFIRELVDRKSGGGKMCKTTGPDKAFNFCRR